MDNNKEALEGRGERKQRKGQVEQQPEVARENQG